MTSIRTAEIVIGYEDVNPDAAGTPILLVHGHPFDRSMWRPQLAHLGQAGHRVLAPDLRGYGATPLPDARPDGRTTLTTFATDLADLLDALGIGEVILGGLSMGGQIVMEFHRLFPDRLRGLILADTAPQAETPEGKRWRNDLADRLLTEGMSGYATEVLPKMISPANVESLPDVAAHVLDMMRATSPAGAAAALRGRAERPDYVPTLADISVPTLIAVGAVDEYTPVPVAEFLHDHIPGSTLTVIDDAAHLPNLERPTAFNHALDTFLKTVTRR